MKAFGYDNSGNIVKAYRPLDGSDWQLLGKGFERWFSVWRSQEIESLEHAFHSVGVTNFTHTNQK